jgi:hypothetical protein
VSADETIFELATTYSRGWDDGWTASAETHYREGAFAMGAAVIQMIEHGSAADDVRRAILDLRARTMEQVA